MNTKTFLEHFFGVGLSLVLYEKNNTLMISLEKCMFADDDVPCVYFLEHFKTTEKKALKQFEKVKTRVQLALA